MCELVQLDPGRRVNQWIIDKKLGEGAFGAVYRCINSNKKEEMFALKVEGKSEPIQLLKMEVFVLNELAKSGGRHFCKIEDKGQYENFNYVVMTFVGKSLQDLKAAASSRKFSFGTAMGVAIQCLEALEDLHGIGYLHRDVKPGNYTIGRAESRELRKIYVLDFGMARKFVHDDGTIKQPRAVAGFRGTVKYAPVACHANREQCRLDDCETWLYMIVELTKGSLPWRNLKDIKEIGDAKRGIRMNEISLKQMFGGCPREYIDIMRVIDGGKFFDEPNYAKMYQLLRQGMRNTNSKEFPYDWEASLMKEMEANKNKKEPKDTKEAKEAKDAKEGAGSGKDNKKENKKEEVVEEKSKKPPKSDAPVEEKSKAHGKKPGVISKEKDDDGNEKTEDKQDKPE